MKNISGRSIETFVAGALALIGFRGLIWIPYLLVVSRDLVVVLGAIFSGPALLIGIAILAGGRQAVFWARIYLLVLMVGALAQICLSIFPVLPKGPHLGWWRMSTGILTPSILFGLLAWSRSKESNGVPTEGNQGNEGVKGQALES